MAAKFAVILVVFLAVGFPRTAADEQPEVSYVRILQRAHSYQKQIQALNRAEIRDKAVDTIVQAAELLDVHGLLRTLLRSRNEGHLDAAFRSLEVASSILEAADGPSPSCINDTKVVIEGLLERETWALQMLDAAGKPEPGILRLQLLWLGAFQECMNITVAPQLPGNRSSSSSSSLFSSGSPAAQEEPFRTKYCDARVPLALPGMGLGNTTGGGGGGGGNGTGGGGGGPTMFQFGLTLGLCVPESCSAKDLDAILNSLLHSIPLNQTKAFNFAGSVCEERELDFGATAITAIVVAAVFLTLMIVGTLFDVIMIQRPRWILQSERNDMSDVIIGRGGTTTNSDVMDERHPLLGGKKVELEEEMKPGLCGRLLASFSVYTNGAKLLSAEQREGSLSAINGIRFLSMSWVILGHVFVFGITTFQNIIGVGDYLKRWTFTAIANATVSVDSFFTMSGLLVTYLVMKELKKKEGKLNWFMFFFHRFWRLTPPYMLLMLVYVPLFPHLFSGPMWPQQGYEPNNCAYWWRNLLYINNLFPATETCMGWSWYLANDMQFYVLSPLIFLPLFHSSVLGCVSVLVFLLVTTVTPGVLSSVRGYGAGLTTMGGDGEHNFFDDIYQKPYCRMGPYIIGMVTGYLLYRTNCRVRLPRWAVWLGWALAWTAGLAVVYGLYDEISGKQPNSVPVDAFYNAVNRTVWGACLCWVIFACVTGHGGFVNTLLSWKAFIPLGRLTYCAYLVHPILILCYFFSGQTPFYLTDFNMVVAFLGLMVASYGVAFIVSLAFEAPMMGLEKVLLNRGKSS